MYLVSVLLEGFFRILGIVGRVWYIGSYYKRSNCWIGYGVVF